ncbi:unnamed protein product [Mytilus coruscus]|uniref:Uncharacterized protein n=1 Tax=Mytilus coruscus TaxID=42192 RepID=A0A6J8ASQ9_MYTCO|nr:unnamed protein product [Mytilus coruscus]
MTSVVSYLKGVRTRFRNSLKTEMQVYVNKLEIQSAKVSCSLEDDQTALVENIVQEDCQLCSDATDYYLELEQYKERLVNVIKSHSRENYEKINPIQIIELQQEMKEIVVTQLKQQKEMFESQQKKEKDECNVKLPKIDIISFNGDKTKWNEFWDWFESTIEKNKQLSKIEKFNYLKSKLSGDAKHAISGLSLSNGNYDVAVGILKDRLAMFKMWSFLDKVNRHLRSLDVLKQDVNQDIFVSMVKSKLPEQVLLQLEIQKGATEKWTVKILCERLRDYVVAREKSDKTETEKDRSN